MKEAPKLLPPPTDDEVGYEAAPAREVTKSEGLNNRLAHMLVRINATREQLEKGNPHQYVINHTDGTKTKLFDMDQRFINIMNKAAIEAYEDCADASSPEMAKAITDIAKHEREEREARELETVRNMLKGLEDL